MPEGDTIFRAARTLNQALAGKTITRFETALAQLSTVDDQSPIAGRTVERVHAAGKNLIIDLSGDLSLRTHMRMNGSWHIYRPGERWRARRSDMRIVLTTADFVAVAFNVPIAEFHTAHSLARQDDMRQIGPDLLGETFDMAEAIRRARERNATSMAELLLNQRVVAGIGNIFKSETLFTTGIDPFAAVSALTDEELEIVFAKARALLAMNVTDNKGDGIVTYAGLRRTTGRSDPRDRVWVYGRRGDPCRRCGTPIEYRKHGVDARSTYWCPTCQPRRKEIER
jgi:endonuclease-8